MPECLGHAIRFAHNANTSVVSKSLTADPDQDGTGPNGPSHDTDCANSAFVPRRRCQGTFGSSVDTQWQIELFYSAYLIVDEDIVPPKISSHLEISPVFPSKSRNLSGFVSYRLFVAVF
ncbi:uncharacterized protein PHALS_14150 [Plasmopara halstedii]|uniref:Uncharacterized protein n=1 Tax=Plasmopara halstedii TaxID=4781 RepID=A0A0P1AQT4_PLAHL|nr:uncharacterized protein PHALS_14150 [Plasmopara halstedii]CEG43862.1 hypothetical protein PHALS_14150 [Plasmopara halstedii]|eukprot:XP_024580231.1 hypothetical protein PHALS_14150 [Plasmopara halstedii]